MPEKTLHLNGVISSEKILSDDVTPDFIDEELRGSLGNVTLWINSPGGDTIAAAQIYNMLKEYNGKVTVKIDGLAASAASVIAMAGDEVLMSPVSLMMIHNPASFTAGDAREMEKAAQILNECKESLINAYQEKTKLSRQEISRMMDNETWMNANTALEKRFIDGVLYAPGL